jgi:glucosamine-6-phosphate deaminase
MVDKALLNEWFAIPPDELSARSPIPLRILTTPDEVHRDFAATMFEEIREAREAGRALRIIVPIGPTAHYPMLAERVNESGLALDHVTFFGMDEWLDWEGRPLPLTDLRSFEGQFHRLFLDRLEPALLPPADNVIFPTPADLERSAREIERRGPVSTTYGGFGFQGHIAFNEPPSTRWSAVSVEELRHSHTRVLPISVDTLFVMAQRIAGGNVFAIPPMAVTLGMRDLLAAKRIRLYSVSGPWKGAILRILLLSEPTVEFPATLLHGHPDVEIIVEADAAECPMACL